MDDEKTKKGGIFKNQYILPAIIIGISIIIASVIIVLGLHEISVWI